MSPTTELTTLPVSSPAPMNQREGALLGTLQMSSNGFRYWTAFLVAVILWGAFAYSLQWRHGLVETGMRDQISWGLYISNFVFFIGISHAGTLISAILRVTDAGWRRPITRMAEGITVVALCIGGSMVLIDLGRPDRALNLFRFGRIQSPIVWDVLSVSTYLTGCLIYFYLPLIPDLALVANSGAIGSLRRRVFRLLSLGWTGSPGEWHLLEKAISSMAVAIIPLAISVHTVVSWIFAMTLRPGWDSSIFGPYFVVGAIYSGAAAVVLAMCILRRVLRLEAYLEPVHYRNLGLLLLSFSLLYLYFNVNEYLTVGYKFQGGEKLLLERLFFGDYAPFFWTVQAIGVVFPMLLMIAVLGFERYRHFTIPGLGLASFLAIIGAWAKRYLIVVPTLSSPFLPIQRVPEQWAHYSPTWVEWSITAAAFAAFLLLYTMLVKFFPVVSVWETRPEEPVEGSAPATAPDGFGPAGWGPVYRTTALIAALLLASASVVRAQTAAHEHPHMQEPGAAAPSTPAAAIAPTAQPSLTITWKALPAAEQPRIEDARVDPGPVPPGRILAFSKPFPLPWSQPGTAQADNIGFAAIQVAAKLRSPQGTPIVFQPVTFALKTLFGSIDYGARPTDDEGKVELLIRDRRRGAYSVIVSYQSTKSEALVDFGVRPQVALPAAGVLTGPSFSPEIGLPFLCFYGGMWCVFVYCFGYLVVYRLRRTRESKIQLHIPTGEQSDRVVS
jgi:molybdopterin-containing oxidoreductase family membrane subunit